MMKILLTIFCLSAICSCIKEEPLEHKKNIVTVEQDTTVSEIEIDINIECYGSNQ